MKSKKNAKKVLKTSYTRVAVTASSWHHVT